MAETVIGKAIELVFEYTVVPVARQLKYVFCYKSCIVEMNKAIDKMKNEKEIVDQLKSAAKNNGQLIHKKADDWLKDAANIQEEVSSLLTNEEGKATMNGCSVGGQLLNPIARHQLGRKATKKKQAIEDLCQLRPKHEEIAYPPPPTGIVSAEDYSVVRAKQQTEGILHTSGWEDVMEKIMRGLKDDKINVIGLHGMGGVGKTTMIKKVRLQVSEQKLFNEVAEAKVTKSPNILRIQEEIGCELGLKLEDKSTIPRANRLRERLLNNDMENEKKKVLIILDDLWEKLDLQDVGIPSSNEKVQIKLLLTSRYENVVSNEMEAHSIHLNILDGQESWEMFSSAVGEAKVTSIKKETATEIARRCGGLPLVIMAIAKALKNKDTRAWEETLESLDKNNILKNLEESYKHLPSDESRDLFLLCGIIRGPHIQAKDLLKYTLGLQRWNRKDRSTLIVAATKLKKLLSGLEDASMLVKSNDSRYVNIHDHMRDLAQKIVDENRKEWSYDLNLSGTDICDCPDASELKLLFSYGKGDSLQDPDSFFRVMKKLYVLEFTNSRVALSLPLSKSQLDHMGNLATLCLHNCSLDDISMIGELKGLQILSFRGSNIRKLPIQLRGLSALKMLDLSDCTELSQIEPDVLGSLTKLEELNMENSFKNWEIDGEDDVCPPSNARLVELKNMPRLSNVWLNIPSTSMLPKDDELFLSTLSIYKIILGDDQKHHQDIIDAYRKETKVMMLKFDDSPNVLHRVWVQATLQKTEVLVLNESLNGQLESIDDVCLKGFECLKHLRVRKCPSIRYIVSSSCGSNYMNLETLYLEYLENLEKLCDGLPGKETFSKLEAIKVLRCKKLTYLFDFSLLKCNSELEKISVKDCREIHSILVIDEDDMKDDVVVKLLKFQRLKLVDLPSFSSFCIPQGSKPSINNVLFSGKKVAFPCLESLKIDGLYELEYIWHPTDPPTEVGDLRLLHVESCSKLVCVINSNVFTRLQNSLETLYIYNCASIKHVFDLRYEVLYRGGRFKLLKEIKIRECDGMKTIIVMRMTGEETQQVAIEFSSLKELKLWGCKKVKTFCWYSMYQVEDMSVSDQVPVDNLPLFSQKVADMEIIKFTFPFLEVLSIGSCPKVKALFIERSPAIGLVSAYDEDLNSNGIRTALFGYGDKQAQSIPNLRSLGLVDLENFTGIWKMEQSDDERCSADEVTLQHNLGGNVEDSEFCIRKLQSLNLMDLPKLEESNIFISNQKWTIKINDKKKKKDKYILFPSLVKFEVYNCVTVKLFDSVSSTNQVQLVNTSTVIEQFLILSEKEIPSSLRSFQTSCEDGSIVDMTIEEHDMRLEQKQHLHLILSECKSSHSSCMSLLPLTSPLFCNIVTRITVECSNGLEYLFTHLGVTRLVHLTYLAIIGCDNIKEIVVAEVEDADNGNGSAGDVREITFKHLKELKLVLLDNLESFFSSVKSFNLNFPSLEKLSIAGCPKMRSFSTATLTTPKLKGVDWNWSTANCRLLSEDLNTTIQKKYAGRAGTDAIEDLLLVDDLNGDALAGLDVTRVIDLGEGSVPQQLSDPVATH